jgi:ABC-type transport system involved in cytochrome c biogenesis permease subunit
VKRKQPARETPAVQSNQPVPPRASSWGSYLIPGVIIGLVVLFLVGVAYPRQDADKQMHLQEFGTLPVVDRGRIKPIDTFARISLMLISHRQDYQEDGRSHSAVEWLLSNTVEGIYSFAQGLSRHIEIPDPEVLDWLQIQPQPSQQYPIDEVFAALQARKDFHLIIQKPAEQLSPIETKVRNLARMALVRKDFVKKIQTNIEKLPNPQKAKIFRIENDQILAMLELKLQEGRRYSVEDLQANRGLEKLGKAAAAAFHRQPNERNDFDIKVLELADHLRTQIALAQLSGVQMVPSADSREDWQTLDKVLTSGETKHNPNAKALNEICWAYAMGDTEGFNQAVKSYRTALAQQFPTESWKAGLEVWFNQFAPFYWCTGLYVLVLILAVLSWLGPYPPLRTAAFGVAVVTFLVHTLALGLRMYIQDRPPVTNLYSSAVFIGWGCVFLCLFLEVVFHNGLSLAVAGATGFPTLIIAHHLAMTGDTLEMMQAVLDTNFWLATHVVCVTLGYTATFVAGFFGIVYVLAGVISSVSDALGAAYRVFTKDLAKTLGQIIYGVVCFATLLSFVGTVLGGIWADQSWGRFWGWDPKENGAVLIVIMNALILHARWAGMVKDRGMALLAIVGNMITAWSWFGTNQLGVGLHAYGFNNTLALGCTLFWGSQLVLLTLGLVPLPAWQKGYTDLPPSALPNPQPRREPRPRAGGDPTGIVPG